MIFSTTCRKIISCIHNAKGRIEKDYRWCSITQKLTDPFSNAISNLLDNAIKYSRLPVIKIGTYNDNDGICITVADNGVGKARII